ncbi:MAG: hypothetical protein QW622_02890 [Candidatus Pacearchaeota archaeon]
MIKKTESKVKQAQIQFQEMAFVLVGLILFFALLLTFFSIFQSAKIKQLATETRREETIAKLESIANMPEFSCREAFCIDEEKLIGFLNLPLQQQKKYFEAWEKSNLILIKVERIWPEKSGKCNEQNVGECKFYEIFNKTIGKNYEAHSTFMPLCYYSSTQGYQGYRCDIGKIIVGFEIAK